MKDCCFCSKSVYNDIDRLLEESNWRPHLVAAVALSILGYQEAAFAKLWQTFDLGSWVSPQLAVAAFLRDPTFTEQARIRIQARGVVNPAQLAAMSPIERHSAAGPAGLRGRSAKAVSTLVQLMRMSTNQPDWLSVELEMPDLKALLAEDIDCGGSIAQEWHTSLLAILKTLDINYN